MKTYGGKIDRGGFDRNGPPRGARPGRRRGTLLEKSRENDHLTHHYGRFLPTERFPSAPASFLRETYSVSCPEEPESSPDPDALAALATVLAVLARLARLACLASFLPLLSSDRGGKGQAKKKFFQLRWRKACKDIVV